MPNNKITYQNSGYFSKLIVDYLDQKAELKSLFNRFPTIENFRDQMREKKENFPFENREILATEIEKQYVNFEISESTSHNIQLLKQSNTYTITTGHQLNLFTGPLYFLYKIVTTINLCKELKIKYPSENFVPVYWMATEDHDFDEINYFYFKDKKISWNREKNGPVGRLSTDGLAIVYEAFLKEIGKGNNANYLLDLFKKSYVENQNLSDATRYLANELFKNEGLVVLDGDAKELKKIFIPQLKEELKNQTSFRKVNETISLLKEYTIQVNPREINLFYIQNGLRERIVFEHGSYLINNTKLKFTEQELWVELENHPENFSPNVIVRPLYQEVILPNLCYIGGGGEIAYWLELKSNFEANNIAFPMLLLRNSVLLSTQKQTDKAAKLDLTWHDLFLNKEELANQKTKEYSEFTIDFSEQKETLKKQFKALYEIANKTDKSFLGAVKAQEIKQLKGLDKLEKRLLKAEKKNYSETLERMTSLQKELFPNNSLQERNVNFSEYYFEFGNKLIEELVKELNPLSQEFKIITL
jgi:bacillithiol synthase